MDPVLEQALIEIFMAVADAHDSDEPLPVDLSNAYVKAFATPEVFKFYGELVDEHHLDVLGFPED